MAAADTQSTSASNFKVPKKDDLVDRLDELLENYLNDLDAYQKAHQQLAQHLSSGYLSLAQANFNNPRGRFGQDHYDERMQASQTVTINEDEKKVVYDVSTASASDSPPATDSSDDDESDTSAPTEPKDSKTLVDPIRWFGILVPPALRATQASFVSAVQGPIPQLCTLASDLRRQEVDIGRLRKQIKKLSI